MEYLQGEDLGTLMERGPLDVFRAVDLVLAVCGGVSACHRRGIVHRDIKPRNIFIAVTDVGDVVKVLDFGVSKLAVASELTHDGQLIGTPNYMSPEQASGKPADSQTDQYAIGVLLYHSLTGLLPYHHRKKHLALLRAIETGDFPPPTQLRAEIPRELEEVILRAMNVSPGARFPNVHLMGRMLLPFASERGRATWGDHFTRTPSIQILPLTSEGALPAESDQNTLGNRSTLNQHETATVIAGYDATTVSIADATNEVRTNDIESDIVADGVDGTTTRLPGSGILEQNLLVSTKAEALVRAPLPRPVPRPAARPVALTKARSINGPKTGPSKLWTVLLAAFLASAAGAFVTIRLAARPSTASSAGAEREQDRSVHRVDVASPVDGAIGTAIGTMTGSGGPSSPDPTRRDEHTQPPRSIPIDSSLVIPGDLRRRAETRGRKDDRDKAKPSRGTRGVPILD